MTYEHNDNVYLSHGTEWARCNSDFLMHYGIFGMKWGVRRFQNEDGTLTAEGRNRYISEATPEQKKAYNMLSSNDRRYVDRQLAKGKTMDQAFKAANRRAATIASFMTLGIFAVSPVTRPMMKASAKMTFQGAKMIFQGGKIIGKAGINSIRNTNLAQKGKQYFERLMRRRAAMRFGGVTLNRNSYSVRDAIGGYLG